MSEKDERAAKIGGFVGGLAGSYIVTRHGRKKQVRAIQKSERKSSWEELQRRSQSSREALEATTLRISQDVASRAAAHEERVAAHEEREAHERRLDLEERDRWLASPTGQRWSVWRVNALSTAETLERRNKEWNAAWRLVFAEIEPLPTCPDRPTVDSTQDAHDEAIAFWRTSVKEVWHSYHRIVGDRLGWAIPPCSQMTTTKPWTQSATRESARFALQLRQLAESRDYQSIRADGFVRTDTVYTRTDNPQYPPPLLSLLMRFQAEDQAIGWV